MNLSNSSFFRCIASICCSFQGLAYAADYWITEGKLGSWVFLYTPFGEVGSSLVSSICSVLCVLAAMIFVGMAFYRQSDLGAKTFGFLFFATVILVSISAIEAAFAFRLGGSFGASYSVPAHAVRYFMPIFTWFIWVTPVAGNTLLFWARAAAGLTFVAHGLEAIAGHPEFVDYILMVFRKVGFNITESSARTFLTIIGYLDLVLGVMAVTLPIRFIFLWMAFWGLLTAFVRVVFYDVWGIEPFFVRTANWALPLLLFYYFRHYTVWSVVKFPAIIQNNGVRS